MWSYETTRTAAVTVSNTYAHSSTESFTSSATATDPPSWTVNFTAWGTYYNHSSDKAGIRGSLSSGVTLSEEGQYSSVINYADTTPNLIRAETTLRIDESDFNATAGTSAHRVTVGTTYIDPDTFYNLTTSFSDQTTGSWATGTATTAATTATGTITSAQAVETVLSTSYSAPTSTSYSTTNSSTTSTTSASTTATSVTTSAYTTSTLGTVTLSVTSTETYSVPHEAILDTVIVAETTDWLWNITTTGTALASAIGVSFTVTTNSVTIITGVVPETQVTLDSAANYTGPTYTYSYTNYNTASLTSTASTLLASTYTTAASTTNGGTIPLSNSQAVTLGYVTTTAVSLTYNITDVSTFEETAPSYTSYTYATEYTTTVANRGTVLSTSALTTNSSYVVYELEEASSNFGETLTFSHQTIGLTANTAAQSSNPAAFAYNELTPGSGFQAPNAMGYGNPVGTNISGDTVAMSWGSAFPGVAVPLYTDTITLSLAGTMNTSTRIAPATNTGSTVGGYGWFTGTNSFTTLTAWSGVQTGSTSASGTTTTSEPPPPPDPFGPPPGPGGSTTTTYSESGSFQSTVPWGVHRITAQNSTGSTSTAYVSWADSLTTYSIHRSECIAFEPAAVVHGLGPIAFSAYPGN